MSDQLFSSSWYRVAQLVPKLRPHSRIHRHRYRGEIWYVLRDPANERFHRFTPAANYVIGIMDGTRTVEEIWNLSGEELGDDAPTQDQMIQLLGQLHATDVLQSDVSPDAGELFERWDKHEKKQLRGKLISPFSIRVPLVDPERFLADTLRFVRPLFGWVGALGWLAIVLPALVLAGVHWTELTENILDRVLAPENLITVWLLFPFIKVLHELGHGYAAKAFGGEIHDMGIMFLIFTPVPYVDASSSWAFSSKYQRALVGAGGVMVEVFVAAIAFYVWLGAEPGVVRSTAYNVLVIAGVTTVLFNANPLLRFDGYYVLCDLAELPNLRVRANAYWRYLTERYAFGEKRSVAPDLAPGEATWFIGYTIAAFVYRMFILVAIFSWILDQFFVVGMLLAGFALVGWLGIPSYKGLKYLFTSPNIRRVRNRAFAVTGLFVATVLIFLGALPMPLRTLAEGVIWIPEEAFVRPDVEGFVSEIVAEPGSQVAEGALLVRTEDPVLETDLRHWRAKVEELDLRYAAERSIDMAAADVTLEELLYASKELARLEERNTALEVRSAIAGSFVLPREDDWAGRFVEKGELIAHVIDLENFVVRAVVSQDDADLVRFQTRAAEVRLSERMESVRSAELVRIVPAASENLPSPALGSGGGGTVPTDPRDPKGGRTMVSFFEVELRAEWDEPITHAGGRVHVRFDHGTEPLAKQWYRRIRQLFLSRFQV